MRLVATEYLSLDGFFDELHQWSRPLSYEKAMRFKWAELQTTDAKLKRMPDGGFTVLVAA